MGYAVLPLSSAPYNLYNTPRPANQMCMNPFTCKLKVDGKGSVKAQPDEAVVVLGVSTENKQLKVAQEENAAGIANVLDTLHKMGVPPENISTQAYTIEPQYDYIEGKQIFRGYRVVHSLEVVIDDIARVGEIIDAAVQSGANQVNSIRFYISDPSAYYQEALEAAVEDAVNKAKTLGRKLNVNVSEVPVQIIEESYQPGGPGVPLMSQVTGAATQIQAGQIEITARIEAVFAYRA